MAENERAMKEIARSTPFFDSRTHTHALRVARTHASTHAIMYVFACGLSSTGNDDGMLDDTSGCITIYRALLGTALRRIVLPIIQRAEKRKMDIFMKCVG